MASVVEVFIASALRGTGGVEAAASPPQWHVCFLGIAAVTLPQPHAWVLGCGHALSGLPGFLTGTISLSSACVHFVDR